MKEAAKAPADVSQEYQRRLSGVLLDLTSPTKHRQQNFPGSSAFRRSSAKGATGVRARCRYRECVGRTYTTDTLTVERPAATWRGQTQKRRER